MAGRRRLNPEVLARFQQSGAEEVLPDAVHPCPRRRGRPPIRHPARERQPAAPGVGRQWMQGGGHARVHGIAGLQPVASLEETGLARRRPCFEHHLGGTCGMAGPEGVDGGIFGGPFRNGRAPVAEDRALLRVGAGIAGHGDGFPDVPRHGMMVRVRARFRETDAEAAEVVAHEVVGIPTAVVLLEADGPRQGSAGIVGGDRLIGKEDDLAAAVAASGSDVVAPCRGAVSVDRIGRRSQHAAHGLLLVEGGGHGCFGRRPDV